MTDSLPPKLHFLTDEDVADSVGEAILEAGHELSRVRTSLGGGDADPVVAEAAARHGLILVTHNYRDFRRIMREAQGMVGKTCDNLHRVELSCGQTVGRERILAAMAIIELEWTRTLRDPARPVLITVGKQAISIKR